MDGILRLVLWALAVLFTAVLTHLAAVLILPDVATRDAYHRLIESVGGGIASGTQGMILLPPVKPDERTIPFRDPALIQGVCFFDLTKAPVRVRTKVEPGRMLSLSFRTAAGRVFYAMTDRGALGGTIDILLLNAAELARLESNDDEPAAPAPELRLQAPAAKGLIIASALVARPGERDDAEAQVHSVICKPEAR